VDECKPLTRGHEAKQRTFCLHFARGNCVQGYECMFLHSLPTGTDDARNSMLHDIFGKAVQVDNMTTRVASAYGFST